MSKKRSVYYHTQVCPNKKWTKKVTTWAGPPGKRNRGRPLERWTDEIKKIAGDKWPEIAQDRGKWSELEEAYTRREVLNDIVT